MDYIMVKNWSTLWGSGFYNVGSVMVSPFCTFYEDNFNVDGEILEYYDIIILY